MQSQARTRRAFRAKYANRPEERATFGRIKPSADPAFLQVEIVEADVARLVGRLNNLAFKVQIKVNLIMAWLDILFEFAGQIVFGR